MADDTIRADRDDRPLAGDTVKEARERFVGLEASALDAIVANLEDRVNDHGVTIAHDGAVPDGAAC